MGARGGRHSGEFSASNPILSMSSYLCPDGATRNVPFNMSESFLLMLVGVLVGVLVGGRTVKQDVLSSEHVSSCSQSTTLINARRINLMELCV